MRRFISFALFFLSLQATRVSAQPESDDILEGLENPPALAVTVTATFPDAEIFGIKLVNGRATNAQLSFSNEEPEPVVVNFIGGSLWTTDFDPQGPRIVRNLTAVQYGIEIPPGEKKGLTYTIKTEMHPQELRLNLAAVVSSGRTFYTVQAFNGTVAVVEPDTSIFDPQIIFLYVFILACFAGIVYFFYNIWIAPYFPQKRGRPGADRSKRTGPATTKKVDSVDSGTGGDASAVATGAKPYNEEWIPSHHIQRPEARKVKSGTPRPKSRGKAE